MKSTYNHQNNQHSLTIMLRYALYARKSDERRERTEKSTGEQTAECRALVAAGGSIVREFNESKSAMIPDVRPLFDEMVRLIKKGEVNALLCWKVDRLARNMKEGGEIAQLLIDGKLREIRTPHACYRPGDNILPLVLETATSAQYSLDLRTNVVRGLGGHFERGGWNACAPQGYRNDRDLINPKVGIIVPDEPCFTLLRKGWDMMLTGAYSPGAVARTLNEVFGYRSRKTVKRGGTKLSRSYAYKLFTNPFYAGYTWYLGQMRPGVHQAMVTEAEFSQVQELLKASMVPHAQVHEFAYTGLMRCGYCGAHITAELHQIKAKGGTKRPYRFYRCTDSKGQCTKKGISETHVEEDIEWALSSVTLSPGLCEIAEENLLRSLEQQSEAVGVVYGQQNAALEELEQQQSRLLSMWLRGLLTDEARYKAMEADLAKQKRQLLLKVGACRDEMERMRANVQASFQYLQYAKENFLVGDVKRRREISKALAVEYVFYGREKKIEIALKPLLVEVVRYADDVALNYDKEAARVSAQPVAELNNTPVSEGKKVFGQHKNTYTWKAFEPTIIRSGSLKMANKRATVSYGRSKETTVKPDCLDATDLVPSEETICSPSHELLDVLKGEPFPDLLFLGMPTWLTSNDNDQLPYQLAA